MANRYRIGGGGNWNDTAYWSDQENGSGGFSSPTSTDNVFFTQYTLTGTITVNVAADMLDFDVTGLTANVTLSNAVYNFSVYGNLKLSNFLLTSFTSTGYLYLRATTSVGIWANGTTKSWNRIYMDGVGGTWTNQDDWNAGSTRLQFANGTLNTNSKTITFSEWRLESGTKTIEATNSTLRSSNGFMWHSNISLNGTNITIDVYSGGWVELGGKTVKTVNLTYTGNGNSATVGGFTCEDLNIIPSSGNITNATVFGANPITINNTLTIFGKNNTNYRQLLTSNTIGTQRTITCNGTIIATNVDFRDIKFTNPIDLSAITGGSGDCGGNSGITFTPSQTQYFKQEM